MYDVDRDNFVLLLQELREAFKKHADIQRRKQRLLLSVAVSASQNIITVAYNASALQSTVDFINLMSYDFHDFSIYFPFVGYNAPLFKRSNEAGLLSTLNVKWSA